MTIPVNSLPPGNGAADIYTDFAGLTALKKSARSNDPEALRQVAKQYESLFARIMIKSMRDAVGKDPIFGSDEGQSYQEMYDDQLSIELTKGKGLGLANLLVQQMQRLTGGGKTDTAAMAASKGEGPVSPANPGLPLPTGAQRALKLLQDGSASGRSPAASRETQSNFISELWPTAQAAGRQLGVDPRNLIAQAALETNWGTQVPRGADGRSSNNLFGMKAGGQWSGASVSAGTKEYDSGTAAGTTAQFRAYGSWEQSFQDYVSLLRSKQRYATALNTGGNTSAFATALQRGGYATDPDYASKITAIAGQIGSPPEASLKSASALPINPNVRTF